MTTVQAARLAEEINATARYEVIEESEDGSALIVWDHEAGTRHVVSRPADWRAMLGRAA